MVAQVGTITGARRLIVAAMTGAIAFTPGLAAAAEGDAPRRETRDDAMARDAAEYSIRYGLPREQAARELQAQVDSVPVTDAIAREFAGRLVGIAIDRTPQWQINVLLTGDSPVAARTAPLAGMAAAIVFRTGARASHSEIVSAIGQYQAAIRAALLRPPGLGVDTRTGEMLVLVSGADAARAGGVAELTRSFAMMTGVPVRVEVSGAPTDMMVGGGARVIGSTVPDGPRYLCTAGFSVSDGARTGVATAAHCPDELSYVGADRATVALPFVSQFGWGYQDVQINASPTPLDPGFFADTARSLVRPVEAQQGRASTRAGDFVCHRGERTGYSCAEVLMTDFAPAGDLCGGACLPTWVAVEGPDCRGGDSGAPVFRGITALGLVKGGTYRADGSCAMYYYMSVDYLPQGWSLLRDPPAVTADPLAPTPAAGSAEGAIEPDGNPDDAQLR